jgi:hypothetical protein
MVARVKGMCSHVATCQNTTKQTKVFRAASDSVAAVQAGPIQVADLESDGSRGNTTATVIRVCESSKANA